MTETVIIEFISDSSGLQPAEDKLAAIGKIDAKTAQVFKQTNTELKNRVSVLTAVGQSAQKVNTETGKMKGTISDLDKVTKSFTQNFMAGFEEGVIQSLKEAGVSSEQFASALKKGSSDAGKSTKSLRAELSAMRQELVRMKLAGKENTEEFKKMEQAAGKLDDAIRDVSTAVKNVGSDTATLEGAVGIFQGVAGAASVATATVALFGEENEDLQEVLLRVNALMAITQGLQSAATVFQKESSAAKLADIIVTRSQAAAQGLYNFVVGTSIGLTKAFKIALASTGVGLLVIALIELVSALQSTDKELEKVNFELKLMQSSTEAALETIETLTERQIANAKAAGKAESDLIKIKGRGTNEQIKALLAENAKLATRRGELKNTSEAYAVLNNAIDENNRRIQKLNNEALITNIELQKQLAQENFDNTIAGLEARLAASKKNSREELQVQKELLTEKANFELLQEGLTGNQRLAITKKLQRAIRELELEFAKIRQQDRISGLEAELLEEQQLRISINDRISQSEIDIQKKIIQQKANLDLLQEGSTENQKLEIRKRALAEIAKVQREFNKQSVRETLQDLISRNNVELSQVELANDEKLRLQIENIITAAEIEISEAGGVADKIKEINAKRDADIKAVRLQSITDTVNYEIQLAEAQNGALIRELNKRLKNQDTILAAGTEQERRIIEKQLGMQRLSLQEQIGIIDELANHELEQLKKRQDALDRRLLGDRQYNLQYQQIQDQQAAIVENAEAQKQAAIKKTTDDAKAQQAQLLQNVLNVAAMSVSVLASIYDNQAAKENNHIAEQKRRIQELRESGAISEKEEQKRLKQLEQLERANKQRQAQREKQIAVFQALLSIPVSVLKGLKDGGLPLAIVYGALASIQAALVAARPIPKFRKGKKDSYEGPGIVGEAGAELIERDGKMYVAEKETFVWLGKKDRVYNPQETKSMMKQQPTVNKSLMTVTNNHNGKELDYDKLAKKIGGEVARNTPQPILNITEKGISEAAKRGNSMEIYLDKRRGWG